MSRKSRKPGDTLTTGEAAALCRVQADTVLKWIHKGLLPAAATAGGHHRIRRADLERFRAVGAVEPPGAPLRCWEYVGDAATCAPCVVFRSRTAWCFRLAECPGIEGHERRFCEGECRDCVYYQRVMGGAARIVVATPHEPFDTGPEVAAAWAANAYQTAALLRDFRPAFVVVDSDLPGWRELLDALAADAAIPGLKIALAHGAISAGPQVDILLPHPLDAAALLRLLARFPVESAPSAGRHHDATQNP